MVCTICGQAIGQCTCPGRDENLHALAYDPAGMVAFKWCRTCDKHYARCVCLVPDFYVIQGGQELPVPDGGWRNLAGGRTKPDLTKR